MQDAMTTEYGGMSKELIYLSFIPGHKLVTTHGSMMVAYEFRGKNLLGSIDEEWNKISSDLNAAIRELNEGWSIHIDVIRKTSQDYIPVEKSAFSHPTSHLVDIERQDFYKKEGNHFENKFIINFCWLFPKDNISKISNMLFEGNKDKLVAKLGLDSALDLQLREFDIRLNKLFTTITDIFPYFRQLNEKEYMRYLNFCINGEDQDVHVPKIFLQTVLGNKDLIVENYPKIGNKYIQAITVYGIDADVIPGMMDILNYMNIEFRFNSRYIFLSNEKSRKEIKTFIEKFKLKRKNFIGKIFELAFKIEGEVSEYALMQEREARSNLPIVESGNANLGYYTSTFILMGDNLGLLRKQAEYIYGVLKQRGFTSNIEDMNNVEAYFGSLPGYTFENVVQLPIFTHQLCNMLPITGVWSGAPQCPNPLYALNNGNTPVLSYAQTSGSTPFKVNLSVRDNSNVLMIGDDPTIINFLAMQFNRYKRSKVFIFDQGHKSYVTTLAMDGTHIELIKRVASEDKVNQMAQIKHEIVLMQPLAKIDQLAEKIWAESWLLDIYELHTGKKAEIDVIQAIKKVLDLLVDQPVINRTMLVLSTYLVDMTDGSLRNIYEYYTKDAGEMLNGNYETISTSNFTTFEIKALLDMSDHKLSVPILSYLFHKIETDLTGSPVLLVVPYLHTVIQSEIFAKKIEKWAYELKNRGVTLWLSNPNIKDLCDSSLGPVLISECPTKIFLSNYAAATSQLKDYYLSFGLNEPQIDLIVEMIPKRHYYMIAERDQRIFELGLENTPVSWMFSTKYTDSDIGLAIEIVDKINNSPEKLHFAKEWLKYHNASEDSLEAWDIARNFIYNY